MIWVARIVWFAFGFAVATTFAHAGPVQTAVSVALVVAGLLALVLGGQRASG